MDDHFFHVKFHNNQNEKNVYIACSAYLLGNTECDYQANLGFHNSTELFLLFVDATLLKESVDEGTTGG